MAYILGIKIDQIPVADTDAKIIALLLRGFSYAQISGILLIRVPTIANKVSALYGLFSLPSCANALYRKALLGGFNLYCSVNNTYLLTADETRRMEQYARQLPLEFEEVQITRCKKSENSH